jgi:sugar phosphate isomerase/epimerase
MEQAKREMEMVAQIGGRRIAAPPAGANTAAEIPLAAIAERYRALLELGDRMGVTPELEFWGSSTNLNKLSQAMDVAIQVNHPKACVLADVFHLYKGGSGFGGLRLLGAGALPVLHMNDYPAEPPRERIADRDRVYPGDGVAPLREILGDLRKVNADLVLSLEVFNPAYWKTDALDTARTGLAKMKAAAA